MNKEQIKNKKIVLDLDTREFIALFAAFGYAAEDLIDQDGRDERKEYYMRTMKLYREELEQLGVRVADMFVAINQEV